MHFGEDAFDSEWQFEAELDIDFANTPPGFHVGTVRNPFHFQLLTECHTMKSFVDAAA